MDGAGHFPVFDGTESVASFAWPSLLSKLGDRLPTLFAAVCGAMPAKFTDDNGQLTYIRNNLLVYWRHHTTVIVTLQLNFEFFLWTDLSKYS